MHRESLIKSLYEAVNGPMDKKSQKRYAESTQTLFKNKAFETETNASEIVDVVVESSIYSKIVKGLHPYLITNKKGLLIGEEIRIVELSSDRTTYKTILSIEYNDEGLKDGYAVITFMN